LFDGGRFRGHVDAQAAELVSHDGVLTVELLEHHLVLLEARLEVLVHVLVADHLEYTTYTDTLEHHLLLLEVLVHVLVADHLEYTTYTNTLEHHLVLLEARLEVLVHVLVADHLDKQRIRTH
jgi:hypothetical protein